MATEVISTAFPSSTLIIILSSVVIIAIILIIIEIILKKTITKIKVEHDSYYYKIQKLEKSKDSSEKKLNELDSLAKSYFRENFNFNSKKSCYELAEDFRKLNNDLASRFCELMGKLYYSPTSITEDKVHSAILIFSSLVRRTERKKAAIQETPQKKHGTGTLHVDLEKIYSLRREAENLFKTWNHKKTHELAKKEVKSKEHFIELASKNKHEYAELKKASIQIKRIYQEALSLIGKIHLSLKPYEKRSLEKILSKWKKEKEKILKIQNPFKRYFEEMKVLSSHLAAVSIHLTKKIIK